jgi:hypothetical protein
MDHILNCLRLLFSFICVRDLCCGFELARISLLDHVSRSVVWWNEPTQRVGNAERVLSGSVQRELSGRYTELNYTNVKGKLSGAASSFSKVQCVPSNDETLNSFTASV